MSFFCLCTAMEVVGDQVEGFKVSTYPVNELDPTMFDERKGDLLLPEFTMQLSLGHSQFLASKPHVDDDVKPGDPVRKHYPNVDIFRCKLCGAGFARS